MTGFDALPPLTGRSLAVTARRRAAEQIDLLTRRGATCTHVPVVETNPLGASPRFIEATRAVIEMKPDVVVVTTGQGVRSWLDAADALGIGGELHAVLDSAAIIARGPKVAGALRAHDLQASWTAPAAVSSEVLGHVESMGVDGKSVAVQLDGSLSTETADHLSGLGAEVVSVPVYEWVAPEDGAAAQLVRSVIAGQLDAITFTSRPAVEGVVEAAKSVGLGEDFYAAISSGGLHAICVGPVTAAAARDAGFAQVASPVRSRLGSMIALLVSIFETESSDATIAGRLVSLRGSVLLIDAVGGPPDSVALSDRERQVLDILLSRGGGVVSKQQLLTEVWGKSSTDTHAVEVTVGRLRRRLGDVGAGIETVFRRGYRIAT